MTHRMEGGTEMRGVNLSIRRKLILISMMTTFIALSLASVLLIVNEYVAFRHSLVATLQAQAKMIGANSMAALTFDNSKDAEEILGALGTVPNITHAVIFASDGKVFARYSRKDQAGGDAPRHVENQGYRYTLNSLDIFEPIILDRENIGTIFLQSDLDEMYAHLSWYIQGSVVVLVLSLLLAYLLLVRLQRTITGPILDLAGVMNTVSRDKSFAIRATVQSRDEIGALAEGFNDMLAQIQIRDDELEQYRENLEELVAARTTAFEDANKQLQQELKARRQYEEGLIKTTKQLEKSNKELEEFAYIASHDLQEPLRKVQAFGDRLNQKYGDILAGQGKEYLDRMQNAAGRMQVLIQSLLEYSRITSKAQEFEPVNLEVIVEEVLSDLEIRMEQVKGQVEVGDLPVINGDPVQMRQLFQNLIGNALKFHREGVAPFISITGRVLPETGEASLPVRYCEIRVADNGIGFDQKYVDRIFGIFQRLHGRTEYEGTGIGLSVCRKIVERHGGTIIAESSPDAGATFIIKLPI